MTKREGIYRVLRLWLVISCFSLHVGYALADNITAPSVAKAHLTWLFEISIVTIMLLLLIVFWLWMLSKRHARKILETSKSLRLSQQRLLYAMEGSNLALWDYDIASGEIYFSEQMAVILGREPGPFTLRRSQYSENMHPEDADQVNAMLKAVLNGDVPSFSATYRVQASNGEWKWLRTYGKVVERDADGEAIRLTGTLADISLHQHMHEELQISENRWRFALEGSGDGVWDWHVASNEMFFSARWKQMLGYDVDEIENQFSEWHERLHPDDLDECYLALNYHFNRETPVYEHEQRMRCKDGSYKWILARGKVIEWDDNDKPVRIIGTHTDVSDRRRMQETLNLQARAMEASIDGILIADATQPDMPIVYCNKAFEELTGYHRDEILGNNCRFLQGVDRTQPELEKVRDALSSGSATTALLRNYHKDGELFWNELSISPVRGENGELTHYIGISNDVTAQIEAREALRREYKFSTTAINAMPGAFFVVSEDNEILRLNDNVASITGYSHAELSKMRALDFYVEEDRPLIADKIAETFREGQSQCEARVKTKSGAIIPFYLQSQKHILGGQECLVGTGVDISNLKRMQQALIQSQATLNTIVEHMPAMVFLKRADDLRYVLLNKVGEEILEYSRDEVVDKTDDELFTQEQAKAMVAVDREVLGSKKAVILPETQFCSRSGWVRYLYTIKTALYDENGQATHLLGISIDISDRKRAEAKLRNSEEQLKEAQRIARMGHWSLDYSNNHLQWSDQIFQIFGHDRELYAPSYENFMAMVHPDDIDLIKRSEQQAISEGRPHSLDHRIVRPDGEIRWVHEEARITYDEAGKPLKLIGTVQDITARKLAEQGMQFSEVRLRTILNTAVDSIIIIDGNGIIELVNPATEKIFGYTTEEMLNHNVSMLMPMPERRAHDGYLQHYQATAEAHIIGIGREVMGQRKDGSTFPMDLAVSEIRLGDRRLFAGFVRDISLRKQVENELLSAKEQAEHANRAKSVFLSNMSHELRTPMNAILGFAQLLQSTEPALSHEQNQDVKEIMLAGQHLLELINQLLDLARIEAGHMEVSLEPVLIQEILYECMQMVEPFLLKQQVSIQPPPADVSKIMVVADRVRLRQVILNLLSNAVKYNKPGGKVMLNCRQLQNGNVRIEVEDTGVGISDEHLTELFNTFARLGAETSDIEGTGIGLAITRQLVELMHGEIGVTSQKGIGSIFWLELPGADSTQPNQTLQLTDESSRLASTGKHISKTVLYIEDNQANLRFMEQLLSRREELRLLMASEPVQGLELSRVHRPDMILLDIHLPGMDGFEVLKRLRAEPLTQDIPVVAVSANAMSADIEAARRAGFQDYCTKPIEIQAFLQILDTILDTEHCREGEELG